MKWHNIGNGKMQPRLPVGMFADALLCEAHVKSNDEKERRCLAPRRLTLQKIAKALDLSAREVAHDWVRE